MTNPPKTRHSKPRKEPVTIDLDPKDVSRTDEARADAGPEKPAVQDAPKPAAAAAEAKSDKIEAKPAAGPATDKKEDAAAKPAAASSSSSSSFGRDATKRPEEAKAKPAPAEQKPAREEKKRGGSPFLGGLIGGIIVAAAGAGGLYYSGIIPTGPGIDDPAAIAEIRAELDSLKSGLAETRKIAEAAPDTAALEQSVADGQKRIDEMAATLDGMKSDIADLKSAIASGDAGEAPALKTLEDRMGELETRIADLGAASGQSADLSTVTARIGSLESQVAELAAKAENATPDAELAGRIDEIAKALADASAKVAVAAEAANAASSAASANSSRLDALDRSVAELSGKLAEQAAQPNVALAIAASTLKSAIDRGAPFVTELDTYAALAPDSADVAELGAWAASGVPTQGELVTLAGGAAEAMIAAGETSDTNAGFFDRLWASALSMIKVRPVGMVEGDGVAAIAARIEAAVKAGDYAQAQAEYDTLPDAPKAAGKDFMDKLHARERADALSAKLLADALRA